MRFDGTSIKILFRNFDSFPFGLLCAPLRAHGLMTLLPGFRSLADWFGFSAFLKHVRGKIANPLASLEQ